MFTPRLTTTGCVFPPRMPCHSGREFLQIFSASEDNPDDPNSVLIYAVALLCSPLSLVWPSVPFLLYMRRMLPPSPSRRSVPTLFTVGPGQHATEVEPHVLAKRNHRSLCVSNWPHCPRRRDRHRMGQPPLTAVALGPTDFFPASPWEMAAAPTAQPAILLWPTTPSTACG